MKLREERDAVEHSERSIRRFLTDSLGILDSGRSLELRCILLDSLQSVPKPLLRRIIEHELYDAATKRFTPVLRGSGDLVGHRQVCDTVCGSEPIPNRLSRQIEAMGRFVSNCVLDRVRGFEYFRPPPTLAWTLFVFFVGWERLSPSYSADRHCRDQFAKEFPSHVDPASLPFPHVHAYSLGGSYSGLTHEEWHQHPYFHSVLEDFVGASIAATDLLFESMTDTESLVDALDRCASWAPWFNQEHRHVSWFGDNFELTENQLLCVEALWENIGPEDVGLTQDELLKAAGLQATRVDEVFRGAKGARAWGKLVEKVGQRPGRYRLLPPPRGGIPYFYLPSPE